MNCIDYRTCIELLMQNQSMGFFFRSGLILILPLISLSAFLILLWLEASLGDRSVYSRRTSFALRLLFLLMFLLALLPALAYAIPFSPYWIMGVPGSASVFQLPFQVLQAIGTLVFGASLIGCVGILLQSTALVALYRLAHTPQLLPVISAQRVQGRASTPAIFQSEPVTPVPTTPVGSNRDRDEGSYPMRQPHKNQDDEQTRQRPGAQSDVGKSVYAGNSPVPRMSPGARGGGADLEMTLPPDFPMSDQALTRSLDYIAWLELRFIGAQRYDGSETRWLLDGAVRTVGRKASNSNPLRLIALPGADDRISREQLSFIPDAKGYRVKNTGEADVQVSKNPLVKKQEAILRNGEQISILVDKRNVYTFVYYQMLSPQLRVVHTLDGSEEIRKTDDFRFTLGGPTPSAGPSTPQPLANIYFDLDLTPPGYVIEREKMQDSREYKPIIVNGQDLSDQVMPLKHGGRISVGNHELYLQIPENPNPAP
jgi:hypothetical protein